MQIMHIFGCLCAYHGVALPGMFDKIKMSIRYSLRSWTSWTKWYDCNVDIVRISTCGIKACSNRTAHGAPERENAYVNSKSYQEYYIYELLRITEDVQAVLDCTGGARSCYVPWDGHITHLGEKVIPSIGLRFVYGLSIISWGTSIIRRWSKGVFGVLTIGYRQQVSPAGEDTRKGG